MFFFWRERNCGVLILCTVEPNISVYFYRVHGNAGSALIL